MAHWVVKECLSMYLIFWQSSLRNITHYSTLIISVASGMHCVYNQSHTINGNVARL